MLAGLLILGGVLVGILAASGEGEIAPATPTAWARTIGYWVFTVAVAFEMIAGAVWDLLRIEFVRVSLMELGYPLYLLYILGPPKILCAVALLVPRFPRLKEWAYAGAIINYLGAAASFFLAKRSTLEWAAPIAFAALTMSSWGLRPATRKLVASGASVRVKANSWIVSLLIAVAMVLVALGTLPAGVPAR